jgi:glyoxylase-like metal-dependent hydrolase (beta-lactamase superfamily II)
MLLGGLALAGPDAVPEPTAGVEPTAPVNSVAPGIEVIFGTLPEGRQPDGNTVIFTAPDGLIVMDTGRHAQQTQQILDFAARADEPIVAIINSHWHLDHIGGNSRIRGAFPNAHIYASTALSGALQGFLSDYRQDLEIRLEKNAVMAGDVWLLDPTTHVLASGDLVTLPVPFLDTACPRGWKSALDHISHANFKVLVPGHGAPMPRAAFETYRSAYEIC